MYFLRTGFRSLRSISKKIRTIALNLLFNRILNIFVVSLLSGLLIIFGLILSNSADGLSQEASYLRDRSIELRLQSVQTTALTLEVLKNAPVSPKIADYLITQPNELSEKLDQVAQENLNKASKYRLSGLISATFGSVFLGIFLSMLISDAYKKQPKRTST